MVVGGRVVLEGDGDGVCGWVESGRHGDKESSKGKGDVGRGSVGKLTRKLTGKFEINRKITIQIEDEQQSVVGCA